MDEEVLLPLAPAFCSRALAVVARSRNLARDSPSERLWPAPLLPGAGQAGAPAGGAAPKQRRGRATFAHATHAAATCLAQEDPSFQPRQQRQPKPKPKRRASAPDGADGAAAAAAGGAPGSGGGVAGVSGGSTKRCTNCHTTNTSSWRRDPDSGQALCNACGQYLKANGSHRPITLAAVTEAQARRLLRLLLLCRACCAARPSHGASVQAGTSVAPRAQDSLAMSVPVIFFSMPQCRAPAGPARVQQLRRDRDEQLAAGPGDPRPALQLLVRCVPG